MSTVMLYTMLIGLSVIILALMGTAVFGYFGTTVSTVAIHYMLFGGESRS